MKRLGFKVIWSAFAVSLMLASPLVFSQIEGIDDLSGTESEVLPDLEGIQKFTPPKLHQNDDWNVEEKNVIQDIEPLKGQRFSVIPWKTQDPEEFLSIDKWIVDRDIRDKNPDWKIRLRIEAHKELMGKVLTCKGVCEVYRGSEKSAVTHLSRVYEEDEFHVGKNSVAWVYLMDGTLLRLAADTMVNFQEINFTKQEVFVLLRLAHGHLFWHPRNTQAVERDLSAESDPHALPLLVREANLEFFERRIYKGQNDSGKLEGMLSAFEAAMAAQFDDLNLRKLNNTTTIKTRLMAILPNATVTSSGNSLDLFHVMGGKSFLKKRAQVEGSNLVVSFRGYSSEDSQVVAEAEWMEVDGQGRSLSKSESPSGILQVSELLTKRIKTYELAREIWFEKFTIPLIKTLPEQLQLAKNFGYSLWGEELARREKFILDDTRRRETTNLRATQNLLEKLAKRGEPQNTELSPETYQASVNAYLMSLKNQFNMRHLEVRHMSDLQYYVWILKNAKK
jgi:hypothetical protein